MFSVFSVISVIFHIFKFRVFKVFSLLLSFVALVSIFVFPTFSFSFIFYFCLFFSFSMFSLFFTFSFVFHFSLLSPLLPPTPFVFSGRKKGGGAWGGKPNLLPSWRWLPPLSPNTTDEKLVSAAACTRDRWQAPRHLHPLLPWPMRWVKDTDHPFWHTPNSSEAK